jgi:hypothetical protein
VVLGQWKHFYTFLLMALVYWWHWPTLRAILPYLINHRLIYHGQKTIMVGAGARLGDFCRAAALDRNIYTTKPDEPEAAYASP